MRSKIGSFPESSSDTIPDMELPVRMDNSARIEWVEGVRVMVMRGFFVMRCIVTAKVHHFKRYASVFHGAWLAPPHAYA